LQYQKIIMMDVESYWEQIRFAKTNIKKELVKLLEQAFKSEIERERLYEDPRWKNKRLEILERDNHKCQICGCVAQDVHHIKYKGNSYNEPWNIENDYLVSLCKECHSKFNGISSEDYVFIPAPRPILLRGYSDDVCQSYSNEVLEIPRWHKIKPILEDFGRYENSRSLSLAIYYPLSSRMWKKRVLNSFKGADELDDYIEHIRYSPDEFERAIKCFDSIKKGQPFLSKSHDFINEGLKKLYVQSKLIPQEGLFALAVRNKKKGYYIKIINIAERSVVKHIDMSDNDEYKTISVAEQYLIGILYALEFLKKKCIEGVSSYSYRMPIFSVWERNLLCPFHYKNLYLNYMSKTCFSSSLDILKFELLKEIGSEYHCEIFQWKKKLWGNEPIYNK